MKLFDKAIDILKEAGTNAINNLFNSNKSYINDIELEVISEKSRSIAMNLPTKRVENGFNISDTVRKEPMIINITVVDNSRAYMLNRNQLLTLQEQGEEVIFIFSNRDTYEHMIIENIEEIETKEQKYGFTYHITLRQIQVGEIKESDVKMDSKKAKTTGGKKKMTTAKVSKPTSTEARKVNNIYENPKGKSYLMNLANKELDEYRNFK